MANYESKTLTHWDVESLDQEDIAKIVSELLEALDMEVVKEIQYGSDVFYVQKKED